MSRLSDRLSSGAQRVQDILNDLGYGHLRVVEFPASTHTAAEAAAAIGCEPAQIAKSLIFRTRQTRRPVLVVASGPNRVNEEAVARRLADRLDGEALVRAEPDFVRASTGFAIGGVPPVGHAVAPVVVIDRDLLRFPAIWAAAGTPNAVFRLTPDELVRLTGGVVDDVT